MTLRKTPINMGYAAIVESMEKRKQRKRSWGIPVAGEMTLARLYIYIYIYRKFQLVSFSCDSKPYNFLAQICLNVFLHIKGMKIIAFSYMLVPLFFQRLKFPFGSLCLEFFQEKLMLFFLVPLVCQSHFVISTAVKFFNLYILWVGSTYKLGFGESSLC